MLSLSRLIFTAFASLALLCAPSNAAAATASASFEARFVVIASCSVQSAAGLAAPRVDCPLSAEPLLITSSTSSPSATHADGPVTTIYF